MSVFYFLSRVSHIGINSSWCFISDPSRIQEPGGRRELAALLGPVPHATEGTAGHVLRGVTVPRRHASAVRWVSLFPSLNFLL